MRGSIEDLYFDWLYAKVLDPIAGTSTPSLTYRRLMRTLHSLEFVFLLPGDDNRAEMGRDLRVEYCDAARVVADRDWLIMPCSVLEMLIAFSRIAEFNTDEDLTARDWFWVMLENLGLAHRTDAHTRVEERTTEAVETMIWRNYDYGGHGGLFPLERPTQDQREVEIWYQFCAYLDEQDI